MSGTVSCYLLDENGEEYDFSDAITNTNVIFGKNQPYLCVEIIVSKYVFDSEEYWKNKGKTGKPTLIQNSTPIHITTYGGTYDLIYTQTQNPDNATYVFLCYTKMWQSKTTALSSILTPNIIWNGQQSVYDSGQLSITCNGITTTSQIGGCFTPYDSDGAHKDNVQLVRNSHPTRTNVSLFSFKVEKIAELNVGLLRVLVPIYTDPTIPVTAMQEGYVNPESTIPSFDNLNTSMRADTVYASILFDYTCPMSAQDDTTYYHHFLNIGLEDTVTHPSNAVQQNVDGQMVTTSDTISRGVLNCKGIEYICGYGQAIFAWISKAIGNYDGNQLVIDKGYSMLGSSEILSAQNFTKAQIENYKTQRTYGDMLFKITPSSLCSDVLSATAIATNRHCYYADVPYLSSFDVIESEYDNALSELTIQYSPESGNTYTAYFVPLGESTPQQIILGSGIQYDDQGSTYLVGKQTARAPNATVTLGVSDAGTDIAGTPIEVSLNTDSVESTKEVLAQIAFNKLAENYHPSNTLSFIALENTSTVIDTDYVAYMKSGKGLPDASEEYADKYYINAGYPDTNLYKCTLVGSTYEWVAEDPGNQDTLTVHAPSKTYFFKFDGSVWVQFNFIEVVERHALFRPDTRCARLVDTRSHTTLENAPLAYTVLSWPDCSTRYLFGEPIFQDTETTIAELQAISKQAITNTSVSEALSKPYVAAAIGNMPLDQAGDDLTDYSGLILRKNDATGVASMDGYSGGKRQVRFSSDGSISSGVIMYHSPNSSDPTAMTEAGDAVVMDREGFHTRSWHLFSTDAPEKAYADGYWVEETTISTDGVIIAGSGNVSLGADGLTSYDAEGKPVYNLSDKGLTYQGRPIIDSEGGSVNLRVDGAVVDGNLRAISITLPYVQIDNKGLRTFSKYSWDTESGQYLYPSKDIYGNSLLQCTVGTNGIITAGAGAVKLDAGGLTTYSGVINAEYFEDTGMYDYSGATEQCRVTTSGELIAGANLYKLDQNGLSYNDSNSSSTPVWRRLLSYNSTQNRTELSGNIYVEAAEITSLSADKITTGNLLAQVTISSGKIIAGNDNEGWSILDSHGLKIYNKGANPENRDPLVWVDTTGFHMDAALDPAHSATIQFGSWSNVLDEDTDINANVNLSSNVALNAGPACAEYIDGIKDNMHYAVTLDASGLHTYSYTYSADTSHTGYATNVVKTLECDIGTNGAIIAGANLVTLNSRGITVGSSESTAPTILSLNSSSFLNISDTTNKPSIFISDNLSSFKNKVEFQDDISVGDEIYLGNNKAKFAPVDITISATARSEGTTISGSGTFNSVLISPQSQIPLVGTWDSTNNRFSTRMTAFDVAYKWIGSFWDHNYIDTISLPNAQMAADYLFKDIGNTPLVLGWQTSKSNKPSYQLFLNSTAGNMALANTLPTSSATQSYARITLDPNYPANGTLYTVTWDSSSSKYIYRANANTLYTLSGSTYTAVPQNTELNVYNTYYAKLYTLSVTSGLCIDIPVAWTDVSSTGGALNEVIQVKIGYTLRSYSARYTQYEGISNVEQTYTDTQKEVQTTLVTGVTAGNSVLHFDIKNPISLVNETLSGSYIYSINYFWVDVNLPLTHLVTFYSFYAGDWANVTGNELMVSNGGIWGSTVVPVPDGNGGLSMLNYGSAPLANTTYVNTTLANYTTYISDPGLKRISVRTASQGTPSSGQIGDICIIIGG